MYKLEWYEAAKKSLRKMGMPEKLTRARIADKIGQSDECMELVASCNSRMAICVAFFQIGRSFAPKPTAPAKEKAAKKTSKKAVANK